MDFSDYYVVPAAYRATVEQLFEPIRITDHGKFLSIITGDRDKFTSVPVAMHFHNDEWAAWGFTVLANGKQIAHGLFGENAETGVSEEDNILEGDLDEAAKLLDVPREEFHAALGSEDVETFVKVVDVPLMSITPTVLERELGTDDTLKTLIGTALVKKMQKSIASKGTSKPRAPTATKSARKSKQSTRKTAGKPARKSARKAAASTRPTKSKGRAKSAKSKSKKSSSRTR